MLIGPESALLTTDIIIGSRKEEATYKSSHIKASPHELVAVIALAPAACAPMQVDIALCSDSTATNSVSTKPSATKEEKYMGISVDGVIGNAPTTSGFICLIAVAAASFPDSLSLIAIYFSSLIQSIAL
jgi:hypothetical protein